MRNSTVSLLATQTNPAELLAASVLPRGVIAPQRRAAWPAASYAVAIFMGAFLVFQVQPVIGRAILPWFGGTPAVWTTCMLFFQTALLAGYAYAHVLTRYVAPRWQGLVHLVLLVAALAALPILPGPQWRPNDAASPVSRILALLSVNVGLPYLVLSSTGPLLQAWFAAALPGRSPYRLYALSNVGSLLALLSYPLVFEPLLAVPQQSLAWSLTFCGFATVAAALAARQARTAAAVHTASAAADERRVCGATDCEVADEIAPTAMARLRWTALPAAASVMLLAVTNHVCQDIAVIPFLWVAPLALYLLSFILCFDSPRWFVRRWWSAGAIASIMGVCLLAVLRETDHLLIEVSLYFAALLAVCMLCHGELVRRKPAARYLTEFYLLCSVGGAIGGLLVAVICPLVFASYVELKLVLVGGYALALGVACSSEHVLVWRRGSWFSRLAIGVLLLGLLGVVRVQASTGRHASVAATRSFYGVLSVDEVDADNPLQHGRVLFHGRVAHGFQFQAPTRRRWPTMYYDQRSGIGVAIARLRELQRDQSRQPTSQPAGLRIGAVGLGVGVIAAYGERGDLLRFYEINPDVERLARRDFSFLADCPAAVDVVLGDARQSLEAETSQHYDLLVLDAFSGDAIPTHLLTREAFEVYARHLAPGGVIAAHISNRHIDLAPVLCAVASEFGWKTCEIRSQTDSSRAATAAQWMLLTANVPFLDDATLRAARSADQSPSRERRPAGAALWTDSYSNLLPLLK
jgi:SAM-dependent methyltransferase